jgi:Spy/CpxP family protein refolding chaperone
MKKLFTFATIAALTLAFAVTATAQSLGQSGVGKAQNNPHRRAGKQQGKQGHRHGFLKGQIAQKLGLTDVQKQRIHVLGEQFKAQLQALKAAPGDKASKKSQFQSLRKQHRESIMGVLTPAQRQQIEAFRKNHGERGQNRRGSAGGGRNGQRRGGIKNPPPGV